MTNKLTMNFLHSIIAEFNGHNTRLLGTITVDDEKRPDRSQAKNQPEKELGDLFRLARHYHPYLARFQNDWATSELVKQYLSNRRKNKSRKERKGVASTSPPDIDHLKREGEQEQEQEQPRDGANTGNIDENWE
ncbi:hypothetical protein SERLA73DRAFT_151835 [Serpula lacrymans var. lacrymans S7.3]|uniref:Uncharacterized protein n=1 Tax=Serpula lacrymans var. lacrymans (strain S7.3) TaxID=936435 RepID=F8PT15_SERL3|nr:hypothetical protein SERLA73DRAFT_151835 [Serpula lacrymans var. lacrymans S7.3]